MDDVRYTKDEINEAMKICEMMHSIRDENRDPCVRAVTSYIDGMVAGEAIASARTK